MTQAVEEKSDRAHFLTDAATRAASDEPEWLKELREEALGTFNAMSFPSYRDEAWRNTDIKPILRTEFSSAISENPTPLNADAIERYSYAGEGYIELVLVDGVYSRELSSLSDVPCEISVHSLAQAIATDAEGIRARLNDYVDATNAFIPLNTAMIHDGIYVNVPSNTVVDKPIHVLYVTTRSGAVASYPRNLFVVGQSSEATFLESYVGLEGTENYLTNGVTEIGVADNAKVTHLKVVSEGDEAYHMMTMRVSEGGDSRFNAFAMTLSGQIVRNDLNLELAGEGGNCELDGLYLNDRDRLIDNHLFVNHAAAKCYSRMGYKGVLDGSSDSVFTGKVVVPPDSQQTDSDQLNNNLLLSDDATIDTNPQLEIFADDVKCTHGATIGAFPSELIFYFQSRGMDPLTAHGILTYGFAAEVVDEIPLDALKDRLAAYVFDKYSPK